MRTENIGFGGYNGVDHQQGQPTAGDQVVIHAVVLNNGQTEANDVQVYFARLADRDDAAPTPIGRPQSIATIPAGGSGVAEVTLDTTDAVGDHMIQVTVDPANFITEVSTTDNSATKLLTVAARPAPTW
ncbi:MAG: CARDB domain-containing protein [Caldilineaceae bacterium]